MINVLVVDNNNVMLQFMQEILSAEGYGVVTVSDGLSALEVLEKYRPEYIFIDLIMPGIDGKKLCETIRTRNELNNARLIVISAVAVEDFDPEFKKYADVYIAKHPFRKMKPLILEVLERFRNGTHEKFTESVLGVDEIHCREINKEFLYNKGHQEKILSHLPDGIIEITRDYKILYANPHAIKILNVPEHELLSRSFLDLFQVSVEKSGQLIRNRIKTILSRLHDEPLELGEDSELIIGNKRLLLRFIPIEFEDSATIIVNLRDITSRKKAEKIIVDSLEEKNALIKMIHHRVKNNFQVISSLLSLQALQLGNDEVVKCFIENQNRITSIALIHENMYHSGNVSGISVKEYIAQLFDALVQNSEYDLSLIIPVIEGDDLYINLEKAIPLGLILNEVINNLLNLFTSADQGIRIHFQIGTDSGTHHKSIRILIDDCDEKQNIEIFPDDSFSRTIVTSLLPQLKGQLSNAENDNCIAELIFEV